MTAAVTTDPAAGEQMATLRARAALAGAVLVEHATDVGTRGYSLLMNGGWSREFDDLASVESLLDRMEGRKT